MQSGRCEREPLPLASAHRARALLRKLRKLVLEQQFFNALLSASGRHAVDFPDKVQVLTDREVFVERKALCHVSDLALQLFSLFRYPMTQYFDLSFGWPQQAA